MREHEETRVCFSLPFSLSLSLRNRRFHLIGEGKMLFGDRDDDRFARLETIQYEKIKLVDLRNREKPADEWLLINVSFAQSENPARKIVGND